MPPAEAATAPGLPPQLRIGGFYLTMFTVMGAFTAFGGIWIAAQGIGAERIGLINALPVALLMLMNLKVGRLADRARDWRAAIVALVLISALGPLGLLLGGGFWPVLAFWTLTAVAQGLAVPVVDAAAIRMARRQGFDYSTLRAWGTVGYIVTIFATGALVDRYGPGAFVPALAFVAILRALMAMTLPRFRPPEHQRQPGTGARRLPEVMRPWFVLPLIGWSMVFATFLILNGFQALLWKQQGLAPGWITFLIALGAIAETAMFFGFRRFSRRFAARHLILASALISVIRWICFAFSPGIAWLIPLQLLHSVTYAMGFMGCVGFIANWTSEDIAAEAQSFFVLLQQAFSVLALSGFGWLAARYGAHAYFASAVFAGCGALLIALSLRLMGPAERS